MTKALRALVVEDDETINALVTLTLEIYGFTVVSVFDGAHATAAAACDRFDVAVVDLVLPGGSGLEVCRRLRDDFGEAGLAIIVLTASDTLADLERAFSVGADDFLAKPFHPRELVSRIRVRLLARCITADLGSCASASSVL